MNILRTASVVVLLALTAVPAMADGFGVVDLPRLDFPAGAEATRACTGPTAPGPGCGPIDG